MSQPPLIGAAYVRVSTNEQTELSPDAQVRVILEAAEADSYNIPPEYIFIECRGISGRRAENRTEFQRMIAIANAGRRRHLPVSTSGNSPVLHAIRKKACFTRESCAKNAA